MMTISNSLRWLMAWVWGSLSALAFAQEPILVLGREGTHCADDVSCFNRLHPDIPMVARAKPGQAIIFKTRNAGDSELDPVGNADPRGKGPHMGGVHPLTGPVHIEGGRPGDVLAVTLLDINPGEYGFTLIGGIGLVSDVIPGPARVLWRLNRRAAVSDDIPGVRIPNGSFPGVATVLPAPQQHRAILEREAALAAAGGAVSLPSAEGAVPAALCGPGGSHPGECVRTSPPREYGRTGDVP